MSDIENAKVHLDNGICYVKKGQIAEALIEFGQALDCDTRALPHIINLATTLMNEGSYDDAISILEFSAEAASLFCTKDQIGLIYYNLGNTYKAKKKQEKAIENYEKALENRPEHASTWYNLGQCYFALTNIEKAIEAYKKAIEINPGHSEAKNMLDFLKNMKKSDLEFMKKAMHKS